MPKAPGTSPPVVEPVERSRPLDACGPPVTPADIHRTNVHHARRQGEVPMKRIVIALTLLAGSSWAANAAWSGAANPGAAGRESMPLTRVACDAEEFYCHYGEQRAWNGYQ